jgi:hypothetical protein
MMSTFSPELSFSDLDFDTGSSIFFKTILLDFTKYYSLLKNLENNDEEEPPAKKSAPPISINMAPPNLKPRYTPGLQSRFVRQSSLNANQMFYQMKIVKEVYGVGSIQEPLPIYYVIFTEATEEQMATVTSSGMQRDLGSRAGGGRHENAD